MSLPFKINNRFINFLPGDKNNANQPRQVINACFSTVKPTQVCKPQLIYYSSELASQLGLTSDDCESELFQQIFSGNRIMTNTSPYAMCYGGHQFGHWAGQLGDGRAINLAEVVDLDGSNQTLQLKGAGLTPYSRTADGLAVLRSSIREFICSEAMYYLGIPTTRALSLCLTGEQVMRDMFYDGHAAFEQGAIVCRVAPSFVRFGSFQIHAARNQAAVLKQLVDYTIRYDFSHLFDKEPVFDADLYENWFLNVCEKTADLMVEWMRVGFVHGVMNTDNMSILGLTIDYGPYGWIDNYDPEWTPNTTDAASKRYSFGKQAQIAQWNLFQLANAIVELVGRSENLEKSLHYYAEYYANKLQQMYLSKLGIEQFIDADRKLVDDLLQLLVLLETDMTLFFRTLANYQKDGEYTDEALINVVKKAFYDMPLVEGEKRRLLIDWLRRYLERIRKQKISDQQRAANMNGVNPKFIFRNYLAQQAIEKAEAGDFNEIKKLMSLFKKPYEEQPEFEKYAEKRPEWAKSKPGCSMLSCSS